MGRYLLPLALAISLTGCDANSLFGNRSYLPGDPVDPDLILAAERHVHPPELSQDPDGNYIIYVSNQSFALPATDITVKIDGKVAVSDSFEVDRQHTWIQHRFNLPPGEHRLEAVSKEGNALLDTTFSIHRPQHWSVLSFWYKAETEKSRFTYSQHDKPIGFL